MSVLIAVGVKRASYGMRSSREFLAALASQRPRFLVVPENGVSGSGRRGIGSAKLVGEVLYFSPDSECGAVGTPSRLRVQAPEGECRGDSTPRFPAGSSRLFLRSAVCSRGRPRAVEEPGLGFAPLPRASAASPLSLCPDHAGHAEPGGTGPRAMRVRIAGWRR